MPAYARLLCQGFGDRPSYAGSFGASRGDAGMKG